MNSNAKFHGKFILVSNRFSAQVERSFKLKLQEFVEYFYASMFSSEKIRQTRIPLMLLVLLPKEKKITNQNV